MVDKKREHIECRHTTNPQRNVMLRCHLCYCCSDGWSLGDLAVRCRRIRRCLGGGGCLLFLSAATATVGAMAALMSVVVVLLLLLLVLLASRLLLLCCTTTGERINSF